MEAQQIRLWLANKRSSTQTNNKYRTPFTNEEKSILYNFFRSKTEHPGPQDLEYLQNIINKDMKKIRAWFNKERYKTKNNGK